VTIDFEKHKRRLDEDPNRVRCAHCGAWILARETRCPSCGVNFRGEAFQFEHELDDLAAARRVRRGRVRMVAIVVGALFLIGVIAYFTR
jgi:uncharacterized membrane protein YvbJ